MKRHLVLGFAWLLSMSLPARGASVFTTRLEDPGAVYVTPEAFGVRGDGASDDSEALQAALDKAAAAGNGGGVFLPSGRYRLARSSSTTRPASRTARSTCPSVPSTCCSAGPISAHCSS